MIRSALLGTLLLFAGVARAADGDTWHWRPLADMAEAAKAGLPMIVCMNHDGENTNDRAPDTFYRDPEILDLARNFIVFMANPWPHGPNWRQENTRGPNFPDELREHPPARCAKFPGIPCEWHRDVWVWVTEKGYAPGDGTNFVCPKHIFLAPDGRELKVRDYEPSQPEMLQLMKAALEPVRADQRTRMAVLAAQKSAADLKKIIPTLRPLQRQELFRLGPDEAPDKLAGLIAQYAAGGAGVPWDLQRDAIVALGIPGRTENVKALAKAAGHKEAPMRQAALDALLTVGGAEALDAVGKQLAKEKDLGIIAQCLEAMKDRLDQPGVLDALMPLRKHAEAEVRTRFFFTVGPQVHRAAIFDACQAALDDRDQRVQAAALWALGWAKEQPWLAQAAELVEAHQAKVPKGQQGALKFCRLVLDKLAGKEVTDEYEGLRFNVLKSFVQEEEGQGPRRR